MSREPLRPGLPVIIDEFDAPQAQTIAILTEQNAESGAWYARYLSTKVRMEMCWASPGPHSCITPIADFGMKLEWLDDHTYKVSPTGLDSVASYHDGKPRKWESHGATQTAKPEAAELARKFNEAAHKPQCEVSKDEMDSLSKRVDSYDLLILREVSGDPQEGLSWGAAMGMSVEKLRRMKLVQGLDRVTITDLGKSVLTHLS
jgi:hypothetical protein